MDRTREALKEMARNDPELAARLVLQTLPAAAARIPPPIVYDLTVEDLGTWRVIVNDEGARVERRDGANGDGNAPAADGVLDFTLTTDASGLAAMAAGTSPLRLMLGGRVRIRGKRRRALKLRAMSASGELSLGEVAAAGIPVDPDDVYRALEYMIDPDWTRGYSFVVEYVVRGDGGGRWFVQIDDGKRVVVTSDPPAARGVDGTMSVSYDTFQSLVAGRLTPAVAMREQLTDVEGDLHPGVMVGRWIDRSQGRDDAEMQRERRQREVQARRAGSWGGVIPTNGNGSKPHLTVEGTAKNDVDVSDPSLAPP